MVEKKHLNTLKKNLMSLALTFHMKIFPIKKFIEFIYEKVKTISRPNCIIFEILESDFIEDFSVVEEFAKTIRALGCKIAIDDFGSGYSNMENILILRPEIIKIDGSLIKNIDTSSESKPLLKKTLLTWQKS